MLRYAQHHEHACVHTSLDVHVCTDLSMERGEARPAWRRAKCGLYAEVAGPTPVSTLQAGDSLGVEGKFSRPVILAGSRTM